MNGYSYGDPTLPRSPVTLSELALLQQTLLFGAADVAALRRSLPILEPRTNEILDVWYGFVGANPHLLAYFSSPRTREPQGSYLAAVRERFGRWIVDTARAEYDHTWLDQQHELGLRHHSTKKNRTDGAEAASIVHMRYLSALVIPITTTLRPFLAERGASRDDVDAMQAAWTKSVLLQTILWSRPYVREGEF